VTIKITATGFYNTTSDTKLILLHADDRFDVEKTIEIKNNKFYVCRCPITNMDIHVEIENAIIVNKQVSQTI
jgi:hypothetical protein